MRTSWLPAQGGALQIPVLGGKRSEKKGLGQWKDLQLTAKGKRRLPAHHRWWEARVPSPARQSDPWGKPMYLCSPTWSQAAGGVHPKPSASPGRPPEPPVPTVRACDGERVCKSKWSTKEAMFSVSVELFLALLLQSLWKLHVPGAVWKHEFSKGDVQ